MLVAAVVVVAGNWQDIAPALKLAGLVLATIALGAAAERSRTVVPATARAVAHLAAALTAPVGIAAAAAAGGDVAGVRARRWRARRRCLRRASSPLAERRCWTVRA